MAEPDRTPSAAAEPGPDADIDGIERDIERTRSQLSGTVEALATKANVPDGLKKQRAPHNQR